MHSRGVVQRGTDIVQARRGPCRSLKAVKTQTQMAAAVTDVTWIGLQGTAGRLLLGNSHVLLEAGSSVAILAILSIARVNNDVLASYQALLTAIYYGNVLLMGMAASGVQLFWRHAVLPWVAVAAIALLGSVLVSLVVLPSLASEKVSRALPTDGPCHT